MFGEDCPNCHSTKTMVTSTKYVDGKPVENCWTCAECSSQWIQKKIFCKDCPEWITAEAYGNEELGCCMLSGSNRNADDFCIVEEVQDK